MNIICVDDEFLALQSIKKTLESFDIVNRVDGFLNPYEAIKFAKDNKIDVAFVDIQMPGINGVELAKLLKLEDENIKIVFITGNDEYALDAYKLDAIGYVLKPYSKDDVMKELLKANRIGKSIVSNRVQIKTFGNFDIFIDGKLVIFNWAKTKEFLAVLVDRRGSYVSTGEMLGFLFEDQNITESIKSYLRTIKSNLKMILATYGVDDIVVFSKNGCAIQCEKVDCDYYRYLDGDYNTIKSFRGEYMSNYSWAEDTLATLLRD